MVNYQAIYVIQSTLCVQSNPETRRFLLAIRPF